MTSEEMEQRITEAIAAQTWPRGLGVTLREVGQDAPHCWTLSISPADFEALSPADQVAVGTALNDVVDRGALTGATVYVLRLPR